MSANVETMFYTGETPWHGLGIGVEGALTSADALKMAGLDWTVKARNIQVCGGSRIEGLKANVRQSDNSVLGVVTDRYKILQNTEAFDFTDMLLGQGVQYETAGSLANGKRIWMLAKMETSKVLGDDVTPYLVFTNSHDGKGAVKVAMTPIRVVCQNTLSLALQGAKRTWSTKHQGDMNNKMQEAQNTLGLATKYVEEMKAEADLYSQTVVLDPMFMEYINHIFPMNKTTSDRQSNNIQQQREAMISLYNNKDDIKAFKGTGWGLMLAATDFATHFIPQRVTATTKENNFMSMVDGNSIINETTHFLSKI